MRREDIDRWIRYEGLEAERERREAMRHVAAFVFVCGAVVLVVALAAALSN